MEAKKLSQEEIAINEQIAALKAKRKELRQQNKAVSFKVKKFTHKKTGEEVTGVTVNGVTHKPMFLYGSQALKLAEIAPGLTDFVETNKDQLTWKK